MDVLEEHPGSDVHSLINKGKRTKRLRPPSPFGRTVTCSPSDGSEGGGGGESSCKSGGRRDVNEYTLEDEEMANCLILLAQGGCIKQEESDDNSTKLKNGFYLFECKTCNRTFPSFQALGGHRASHKKPKAITDDKKSIFTASHDHADQESDDLHVHLDNTSLHGNDEVKISTNICVGEMSRSKEARTSLKVHECSICGTEFSSGQALGGHMRRHRNSTIAKVIIDDEVLVDSKKPRNFFPLDLNLPAPEDDHRDLKFQFGDNQQLLVFSAPALVDCHY